MGLLDEAKPTPRNRFLGLLADAAQSADEYANAPGAATGGKANPPLAMLADLLGVGSVARTLDRLSYGEPITNYGKANVPLIPQDTAAAAMAAIPVAQGLGKGAVAAAKFAGPKAAGMAENYMARSGLLQPATVWHGSPHKFDRFDSSKIGTGEGAQAYGHGLYLAESPEVSKTYMRTQINNAPELEQMAIRAGASPEAANTIAQWFHSTKDTSKLDNFLGMLKEPSPSPYITEFRKKVAAEEPALRKAWSQFSDPGNLYKVDLPDSAISRMLDWDKPLSDQSAFVAGQLERAGMYDPLSRMSHGTLWHDISALISNKRGSITKSLKRDQMAAAEEMHRLGIPGIRYLDGGSRGAGTGTSNYVVFPGEEGLLTILERNGVPLK